MQNIPTQIDDSTELPADEFNQIPTEVENAITASNIALSASDLTQLAKTISNHVGGADYYNDAGVKNAYVLTQILSFKVPTELFVGLRVRFVPVNDSDSAIVTLKLGSLAAVSVNYGKLANGGTPSVPLGYLDSRYNSECVYQKTDDGLTSYWRLITQGWMVVQEGENSSNASMWKNMQYMSESSIGTNPSACVYFHGGDKWYSLNGVLMSGLNGGKTWDVLGNDYRANANSNVQVPQTNNHVVFPGYTTSELLAISSAGADVSDVVAGLTTPIPLAGKGGYDLTDNILVCGGAGAEGMRFSLTGIGGTWVSPTTPISNSLGSETPTVIEWCGGDTFVAVRRATIGASDLFISTDNCDTWSLIYTGTVSQYIEKLSSNKAGVLIAKFTLSAGVNQVRRSYDNGSTWTTVVDSSVLGFSAPYDIKHLNDTAWMIVGNIKAENSGEYFYASISIDDGESWSNCFLEDDALSSGTFQGGTNIGFSNKMVIFQKNNSANFIKTLTI